MDANDFKVIIVGAGFGGIAAAIELKKHGIEDLVILEAAPAIGGTWHYNTYPGAACDVPSHLYSYSFAQRANWSRFCSPQAEILSYIHEIAETFDVTRHVRTSTRVTACRWDDATAKWSVEVAHDGRSETLVANAVVLATGQLNQPSFPEMPGRDSFLGHGFHSARWDHAYPLEGKRVAVIGNGASAVQFVPEIAPKVAHLSVFQRTGNWLLPREHAPYSRVVTELFRRAPPAKDIFRAGLFQYLEALTTMVRNPTTFGKVGAAQSTLFMRSQLKDPAVRKKAWPTYPFGCKRVLFSSAFLPALQRPNVSLITDRITKMAPVGPETEDGRVHEVDCVIYATGFKTTEFMFPMGIFGAGGQSLRDVWSAGPRAHLGMTVHGFPSLFIMYGPNTNTSGGSILFFLEAQAKYLRQAIELARDHRAGVDVRADVEDASTTAVQERFAGTAWLDCDSWYRNGTGRIVANWPGYMREYARATDRLIPSEYAIVHPRA